MIEDVENKLLFSAASLWEVMIKRGLGREDFQVDARVFRRSLLDNGYAELPINSEHVINIDPLPAAHKDPFDRLLVAQAMVEGITLLTSDAKLELSRSDTKNLTGGKPRSFEEQEEPHTKHE